MTTPEDNDDELAPMTELPMQEQGAISTDLPISAPAASAGAPAAPDRRVEVEELVARRVVAQGLYLVDDNGLARASVQLENGQAVQTLYDAHGKVRARLQLGPGGAPSISLTDEDGQIRAQMYLKEGGDARVGLADAAGKLRIKFYLDEQGRPSVGLADAHGRPTVIIGEDESGGVSVRGAGGEAFWTSGA